MAGYVIRTREGLSAAQQERAAALGPSWVTGFDTPGDLGARAGLAIMECHDVTEPFRHTCVALRDARLALEGELRQEEGDTAYEDELAEKEDMLRGIDENLLIRSLIVAVSAR